MTLLNVADIRLRSSVNGPGTRSVVWVQGCTIGCPGCFNPHTHAHEQKRLIDPVFLAQRLAEVTRSDGLTISGGEPFEQAEACAMLAEATRSKGRSVVVFSGYRFDVLNRSSLAEVQRLLAATDLLIAGPYVSNLPADTVTWRGSTNQTVHALTNRITAQGATTKPVRPVVEITVDGCSMLSSGFPERVDQDWLKSLETSCTSNSATAPRQRKSSGHVKSLFSKGGFEMHGMMIATKGVSIDWHLVGRMWQVSGAVLFALGVYCFVAHYLNKSRSRIDKEDSKPNR